MIEEIHSAYLEAGADIIETDTFNSNALSMGEFGLEEHVAELNRTAAQIARSAADAMTRRTPEKPRFVAGSIGLAASANIDPTRRFPSMFEPVHGSAPDIAGKGIANPLAAIFSAAMMLDHLGLSAAADEIDSAIRAVLAEGSARTPDLGGRSSTEQVAEAVTAKLGGVYRT